MHSNMIHLGVFYSYFISWAFFLVHGAQVVKNVLLVFAIYLFVCERAWF